METKVVRFGGHSGFIVLDLEGKTRSASGAEEIDQTVPFPMIGLSLGVSPARRHRLDLKVSAFSLSSGDTDGGVLDAEAGYRFFPIRWLAIGAGYRRFGVDVDVDVDGEGTFDLDTRGVFHDLSFHI